MGGVFTKKIIFGGILILASVILFGIIQIPTSKYCLTLGGWTNPPGKYMTALQDTGNTFLFYLSLALLILGILLGIYGCFKKS